MNAGLALASVSLVGGVAELAARALAPPLTPLAQVSRDRCWQRSALLGHELRPNCDGREGDKAVHINSLGLRSPELRTDGSLRILAIGDSCTFGYAVDANESYPAVLQRLLDARGGAVRWDVVNAGVEAYTSLQGLVYLRERGLALRPLIVIFGFGFNDAVPEGDLAAWLPRQRRFLPLLELSDWLSDRSTLWLWLLSRPRSSHAPARVSPPQFERNVRAIVEATRGAGAKALALSFAGTKGGPYHTALTNVTEQLDVPVVTEDGPRLDVVHPTAAGYAQLADRILAELERSGLLKWRRGRRT